MPTVCGPLSAMFAAADTRPCNVAAVSRCVSVMNATIVHGMARPMTPIAATTAPALGNAIVASATPRTNSPTAIAGGSPRRRIIHAAVRPPTTPPTPWTAASTLKNSGGRDTPSTTAKIVALANPATPKATAIVSVAMPRGAVARR